MLPVTHGTVARASTLGSLANVGAICVYVMMSAAPVFLLVWPQSPGGDIAKGFNHQNGIDIIARAHQLVKTSARVARSQAAGPRSVGRAGIPVVWTVWQLRRGTARQPGNCAARLRLSPSYCHRGHGRLQVDVQRGLPRRRAQSNHRNSDPLHPGSPAI